MLYKVIATVHKYAVKLSSWWSQRFQPIWKIFVKIGIFPNFPGEHETYMTPPPRYTFNSLRKGECMRTSLTKLGISWKIDDFFDANGAKKNFPYSLEWRWPNDLSTAIKYQIVWPNFLKFFYDFTSDPFVSSTSRISKCEPSPPLLSILLCTYPSEGYPK